jgi:hypothetical protein
LQDSVRDVNDIHAIADLICQSADSLGYRLIKVEATANPWFAIVRLSRARWFRIDSDGECHQFESLQMKLAPNMRLKLSGWGGHIGRKRSILIVAAPARSLSAIR